MLQINDSPSLPYRGVLLDVSQGRVPNLVSHFINPQIKNLQSYSLNNCTYFLYMIVFKSYDIKKK